MIIICPNCKKQHNIDERIIPAHVKKAKCKFCGNHFPLDVPEKSAVPVEQSVKKEDGPRKISVSLSKGGVGKTTTAVNLAVGLSLAGYKVLLVDTDTQGQSSYMLGVNPKAGLTELVMGELSPEETMLQVRERLWLLAGGKSLAGVKRLIGRKDFGGELTLAETLTEPAKSFDYVIVDTSPGWDPLTVNILFYVTEILTPVSLEVMSIQGLVEFLKSISAIQKYRPQIALKYILPTFLDMRVKKSVGILEKLQELYGNNVCAPIRYNVRLSEAPAYGKSIYEFAPGSPGATDYRELVRKVANNNKLFR
jgi:chromosome partitioning protein